MLATVPLHPILAGEAPREVLRAGELSATLLRFHTGIPALRLANARGEVVVLPWMGGMVWSVRFDGVDLNMESGFDAPRPTTTIAETYGCFAFTQRPPAQRRPGAGGHPRRARRVPLRRDGPRLAGDGPGCGRSIPAGRERAGPRDVLRRALTGTAFGDAAAWGHAV